MSSILSSEIGGIRKKWKGLLPVALIYPNTYPVAISNLGFQLVYALLNDLDFVLCERFVYPDVEGPPRSLESNRPLTDFPLVLASISFENDFPALIRLLAAGLEREPTARTDSPEVKPGAPLVILGGVGVFMNPEPLAPFADLMVIGEAEPILADLIRRIDDLLARNTARGDLLRELAVTMPGCYVPSLYSFRHDEQGVLQAIEPQAGAPARVRKVVLRETDTANHSRLLSPAAELGMFMTELGRGCGRGCRFCAAGFIYRPPRLWSAEAVIRGLEQRPEGIKRIGLLGMEMAAGDVLSRVGSYLRSQACALSFSSLRADRISDDLLALLAESSLKSAAIAPDGCSERLRRVINKNLTEHDLLDAASRLVEAGIFNLKIYVMIGLPTETDEDLREMIKLIKRMKKEILPIGRARGRVSEITLSLNSFTPKPWTPFQYVSFGGLDPEEAVTAKSAKKALTALKNKIKLLRKGLAGEANVRLKTDRPEAVLQQAVFSRGDRRLAPVLLDMARGASFRQAMKKHDLSAWHYAVRPRSEHELFCWDIVDHGIAADHLWREYQKALRGGSTTACNTATCRRCGVCNEK